MNKKDIFKNVYKDFFGIEKLSEENQKLANDIENLSGVNPTNQENEIPEIEVDTTPLNFEEKDNYMKTFFEKIDNLYIDDNSKDLLKKVIEYMRKYDEKVEKKYISFNMCLYSNNDETVNSVMNILTQAGSLFSYIKEGRGASYSLYSVDDVNQLNKIFSFQNSLVVLRDFEGFNTKEQSFKDKFINTLDTYISKNENEVLTILNSTNKELLKQAFQTKDNFLDKFADFEIFGINPDVAHVYTDILEKLKDNMKIDEKFEIQLLDYISVTYPNNSLPYPQYRDNLCEKILFTKQLPEYNKDKSMDEIFAELNSLVGLQKVKTMLKDLVNLIELKKKTQNDLKIKNINLHMIFLGNPGTGKTTVARIVAEMLYNLKYIKQNKLIEVSSKDLVAEYVGQTAPKTMAVIQKALGGVLFIDEAYSLASGNGQGNSFNEEAIATLIQAMENYRDELVVIFAGYTKEMQDFLNSNSGIVSRIGYTVEFDDYTPDELIKIFDQMMQKSGFIVTTEALNKVRELINEYKDSKNFGNARFVRNIYEKSIIKHASNTKDKRGKKLLRTIDKDDISAENLLKM